MTYAGFTPFTGFDPMDGDDPRVLLSRGNPCRVAVCDAHKRQSQNAAGHLTKRGKVGGQK